MRRISFFAMAMVALLPIAGSAKADSLSAASPGLGFIIGGANQSVDSANPTLAASGIAAGSGQSSAPAAQGNSSVGAVGSNTNSAFLIGDAQLANYGKDTTAPYKGIAPAAYADTTGGGGPSGYGGGGGPSDYSGDVLLPDGAYPAGSIAQQ